MVCAGYSRRRRCRGHRQLSPCIPKRLRPSGFPPIGRSKRSCPGIDPRRSSPVSRAASIRSPFKDLSFVLTRNDVISVEAADFQVARDVGLRSSIHADLQRATRRTRQLAALCRRAHRSSAHAGSRPRASGEADGMGERMTARGGSEGASRAFFHAARTRLVRARDLAGGAAHQIAPLSAPRALTRSSDAGYLGVAQPAV